MKVGIITIPDLNNLGNRLQNYAVAEVLKKQGVTPQTIRVVTEKKTFLRRIKKSIRSIWYLTSPESFFARNGFKSRYTIFERFTNKYISEVIIYEESGSISQANSLDFDCIIVGSDQVWNPTFSSISNHLNNYLLSFTDIKKVSYAASFGVNELPNKYKGIFSDNLKKFDEISVREDTGATIIKELIDREVDVLVDPTLMLSKEEWLDISKISRVRANKKPYILKYFLGEESEERKEYINSIALSNGLEEYKLMDFHDSFLYMTGPDEFIDLVSNASLICTDSFHAMVFSIIFSKPFLVMERDEDGMGNMSTRITSLLRKLGLERKLPGKVTKDSIFECDYSEAYKHLKHEQERALRFFERVLKQKTQGIKENCKRF